MSARRSSIHFEPGEKNDLLRGKSIHCGGLRRGIYGCPLVVLLLLTGVRANAQVALSGVMTPNAPKSGKECIELSARWYEKVKQLERANNVCSEKDGGTIKASGVWMPNCGRLQQAYITCAPVMDQLCSVRNKQSDAMRVCTEKVSAYQTAERERLTLAQRLQSQADELKRVSNAARAIAGEGPAAYLTQQYTATPEEAARRVHGIVKESARTAGTTNPDSQPMLNRVGEVSDRAYRDLSRNQAITEIGSQSAAHARARAGDALNQMDAMKQSEVQAGVTPASRPASVTQVYSAPARLPTAESEDEEEDEEEQGAVRERSAARLEMLRQANSTLQGIVEQRRQQVAPRANPTTGSTADSPSRPNKWKSPERLAK